MILLFDRISLHQFEIVARDFGKVIKLTRGSPNLPEILDGQKLTNPSPNVLIFQGVHPMSNQNVISASLSEGDKALILQNLSDIKSRLNFLITLDPDQLKSLFKPGNGYTPFIEKAHAAAQTHPDILPRVFASDEFEKDYLLIQALTPIQAQINELAKSIHDTLTAANSDAMVEALEVYAAVKQHKDKVPGLAVAYEELSAFFQRSRKKTLKAAA
jgi:hypothetical protein